MEDIDQQAFARIEEALRQLYAQRDLAAGEFAVRLQKLERQADRLGEQLQALRRVRQLRPINTPDHSPRTETRELAAAPFVKDTDT